MIVTLIKESPYTDTGQLQYTPFPNICHARHLRQPAGNSVRDSDWTRFPRQRQLFESQAMIGLCHPSQAEGSGAVTTFCSLHTLFFQRPRDPDLHDRYDI